MKEKLKAETPASDPATARLRLVPNGAKPSSESQELKDALQSRQSLLRREIASQVFRDNCPTSAALVIIRPNGVIELSIIGAEPEQADLLADGLDQLAARLRLHAERRPRHNKTRGIATIATLVAITFATLTFVNEIAWVDATLSLASQLAAASLLMPRKRSKIYPHTVEVNQI